MQAVRGIQERGADNQQVLGTWVLPPGGTELGQHPWEPGSRFCPRGSTGECSPLILAQ